MVGNSVRLAAGPESSLEGEEEAEEDDESLGSEVGSEEQEGLDLLGLPSGSGKKFVISDPISAIHVLVSIKNTLPLIPSSWDPHERLAHSSCPAMAGRAG